MALSNHGTIPWHLASIRALRIQHHFSVPNGRVLSVKQDGKHIALFAGNVE